MWCIIYPICALPLLFSLFWVSRKAKKTGALDNYRTPYQLLGGKRLAIALFWQLDVIGVILLIAVFGLILVPFAHAKGDSDVWASARIIAPLVVGLLCIPVWLLWERRAPHPMLPFHVSALLYAFGGLC